MNAALAPIAPPDYFPVAWDFPGDADFHWTRDREHMPLPITPMFSSVARRTAAPGYERVVPIYDEAVVRRHDRTINTYGYTRLELFAGAPADLQARMLRHRQKVGAVCAHLEETWEQEWRPAIEAHWDFWRSFDLASASLPELAAHLGESLEHLEALYEIHYRMGAPMWFALDEFETFYCDLFPESTPLEAHRLLQGFDNKTLEIGRSLWQLSRLAKETLPVRHALENLTGGVLPSSLQTDPAAQPFLHALQQFLQEYGRRSDLWDWGYPSWQDDPTPIFQTIKTYLTQPDRDLYAELVEAAAERQVAIARARQALQGYPTPIVQRFEELLRTAQVALMLTENHTYYLDFNGFGWMHCAVQACGERLASQGRLRQANDVFYLKIEELQSMLLDPALNLGEQAHTRRQEAEYWAQRSEPCELGRRPAFPPYIYSPESRRMMRYIGGLQAEEPLPPAQPGTLRGQAGSSGKVRGPARLVHSLAEAHRLQPGDILVTTTTAPPWTPLFLTAAGLVTDAGGMLSHGAVVCREYRLPAVVGVGCATRTLVDGQLIEVDGDHGIVRIL